MKHNDKEIFIQNNKMKGQMRMMNRDDDIVNEEKHAKRQDRVNFNYLTSGELVNCMILFIETIS